MQILSKLDEFSTIDLWNERNVDGNMTLYNVHTIRWHLKISNSNLFSLQKLERCTTWKWLSSKKHNLWSAWTNYSHSCNSGKYNRSRYNSLTIFERRCFLNHTYVHICSASLHVCHRISVNFFTSCFFYIHCILSLFNTSII